MQCAVIVVMPFSAFSLTNTRNMYVGTWISSLEFPCCCVARERVKCISIVTHNTVLFYILIVVVVVVNVITNQHQQRLYCFP